MKILLNGEEMETTPSATPTLPQGTATQSTSVTTEEKADLRSGHHSYRLEELAYLRSGDKGNTANIGRLLYKFSKLGTLVALPFAILWVTSTRADTLGGIPLSLGLVVEDNLMNFHVGVIARHPGYLPYIKAALTPEVVADYFSHLIDDNTPVERYVHICTKVLNLSHTDN